MGLQRYEWRVTPKQPIPLIERPIQYFEWGGFTGTVIVDKAHPPEYPTEFAPERYEGRAPRALENTLRRFQPTRPK